MVRSLVFDYPIEVAFVVFRMRDSFNDPRLLSSALVNAYDADSLMYSWKSFVLRGAMLAGGSFWQYLEGSLQICNSCLVNVMVVECVVVKIVRMVWDCNVRKKKKKWFEFDGNS